MPITPRARPARRSARRSRAGPTPAPPNVRDRAATLRESRRRRHRWCGSSRASSRCVCRLERAPQLHQVSLRLVGRADLVDVSIEVLGSAALGEEGTHRVVDQAHGFRVGALVLVGDDPLDVAAVDAQRIFRMLGSSSVGKLQPEVARTTASARTARSGAVRRSRSSRRRHRSPVRRSSEGIDSAASCTSTTGPRPDGAGFWHPSAFSAARPLSDCAADRSSDSPNDPARGAPLGPVGTRLTEVARRR